MRISSLTIVLLSLLFAGCGGDDSTVETTKPAPAIEQPTRQVPYVTLPEGDNPQDWVEIRQVLEDALVRLAYNDKTGLWENEFPYLREQETLDKYLKRGEITWANADSLLGVEIERLEIVADTATVRANFVFANSDGGQTKSPAPMLLFRVDSHWINPYVSSLMHQKEYENLIRKSLEDSEEDW